jgi:hypothetical protein
MLPTSVPPALVSGEAPGSAGEQQNPTVPAACFSLSRTSARRVLLAAGFVGLPCWTAIRSLEGACDSAKPPAPPEDTYELSWDDGYVTKWV